MTGVPKKRFKNVKKTDLKKRFPKYLKKTVLKTFKKRSLLHTYKIITSCGPPRPTVIHLLWNLECIRFLNIAMYADDIILYTSLKTKGRHLQTCRWTS